MRSMNVLQRILSGILVLGILVSLNLPAAAQSDIEYAKSFSNAFSRVAEKITPAVVSIEATKRVSETGQFRGRDLQDIWPFRTPPEDFRSTGMGSGVIIDKEGYILTNNHVVENAEKLTVRLNDVRQFDAQLIGNDPQTDVAVIKIEGENLPYANLGNSDDVKVGEWVLAIGTPFGEILTSTVTAGIVSAVGRNLGIINAQQNQYRIENFIQTDAAINPGNSGGPLVNIEGEVIGINTAIVSSTGQYQGYGFAIPINLVRNIADDLRKYGKVRRGIMGVQIRDVGQAFDENNKRLSLQEDMKRLRVDSPDGVVVVGFSFEDSPGMKAGLKENDVIVKIDGKPISRTNQLQTMLSGKDPGDQVTLTVMREGSPKNVTITLGSIPEQQAPAIVADVNVPEIGIDVREAQDTGERGFFSRHNQPQGVQVVRVVRGSQAEEKNIEIGDFIYKIDKTEINTVEDFRKALDRARNRDVVTLYIRNDQGTQLVNISLR